MPTEYLQPFEIKKIIMMANLGLARIQELACCLICLQSQNVLLFIAVSIENIITDLAELTRGMDMTKREFEARKERDPPLILKDFLNNSEDKLKKLKQDAKTAQVSI